jgi:sister chromatid cohesion protein PDS5
MVQFICQLHLYRSLPSKKKGQPTNKRRKTAGRNNSVEEGSGAGGNDSDSSSSLARSDVDKDVNSGMIA